MGRQVGWNLCRLLGSKGNKWCLNVCLVARNKQNTSGADIETTVFNLEPEKWHWACPQQIYNDTKSGVVVDQINGRASIQRNLEKFEDWVSRHSIKFHKRKHEVVQWGWTNPSQWYKLGSSQAVESPAGTFMVNGGVKYEPAVIYYCKHAFIVNCLLSYMSRIMASMLKEVFTSLDAAQADQHFEYYATVQDIWYLNFFRLL